jgi:hypothetical protein
MFEQCLLKFLQKVPQSATFAGSHLRVPALQLGSHAAKREFLSTARERGMREKARALILC